MSNNPFITVCIDGVSGVNPVEISRTIQALMDIPAVGRFMPQHEQAYELVLSELCRLKTYLPSLLVSPSNVSLVASGKVLFEKVPWRAIYPEERTLFVVVTENVMDELKTEGSEFLYTLMGPRVKEQEEIVKVIGKLGQMGYRTKTIPVHGTQLDLAKRVIQEIRLTRRNIMETDRRRSDDE